ncbi:fasciclin-like arabinogalactan protein 2 [Amborella trichopoda]|uniref:FAS1 domain-containing protein n=1 Tax=Amborella trichopoda TaxID=13333 RepID=W1PDG2_AMBTC|nr:fasciclin-like arabinogalactan protein 2 [Amborella trichopoda]ERN05729.1 hypothetical protein AMTR_s00006p00245830 [Amborella trichopoda]|eukprot:XP_006844054.1 fasciclin-like arabinogalactan protein 2 [Amborella trichopoda]
MRQFPAALLFFLCLISATSGHNITKILAQFHEFSKFNDYLSRTHLASEINRRTTITVLAVDNAAMDDILAKNYGIYEIKNILSLHILLDYFGAKKLHQITNGTALAATLYQTTGSAPGTSGFVNITDEKGGKVSIGADDNGGVLDASYVKSVKELPYNISVLQVSKILNSPSAEAPAPAPTEQNLTAVMTKKGCKLFADQLTATGAEKTFVDAVSGGLTAFCPTDDIWTKFVPKYKNLSADHKVSLLLFHGVPIYQSMQGLKSNNGPMNTLATDGAASYSVTVQNDGEQVTLKTKAVTAKITGTIIDEDPLAVFSIDKVLQPKELFAGAPAPAPAPEEADSPSPSSAKVAAGPASDSPDDAPADDSANDNGSVTIRGGLLGFVITVLLVVVV